LIFPAAIQLNAFSSTAAPLETWLNSKIAQTKLISTAIEAMAPHTIFGRFLPNKPVMAKPITGDKSAIDIKLPISPS
jgi:hypothetical protein